jgi:flavin-dependent dehydrogenase
MHAKYENLIVTEEFLNKDPNAFFVFGDNLEQRGTGGAAKLRHHPRAIGFVTKKAPDHQPKSCYTVDEYSKVFFKLLNQLKEHIVKNPTRKFYISKLGAGLANRYMIWELVIKHNLTEELAGYDNVVFCWDENE